MQSDQEPISYIGFTNSRRQFRRFGIKQADRLMHLYMIGKTGVGKTTLLKKLAEQDLHACRGFCVVDPHGELVEAIYRNAPEHLRARITYFDPSAPDQPYGYNPLRRVREPLIPIAASGLLETLRKLWPGAWGVRMEHVLRNCLFALLELGDARLPDILRLFDDEPFRKGTTRLIRNPIVRAFWTTEYENYPARLRAEAIAPIQNKIGALLTDPRLRRVFVEAPAELRFRRMMDEGQVLLVNASKGRLGEDASNALGSLVVNTISLAAFSRADEEARTRRSFFLYVDEFQNFTTLAFANMMAELRKYGVGLILAHQHLHQLEPDVRHAVIGNAGTFISFRVGAEDARLIASELQPTFDVEDLINLPNFAIYLKLMIDGTPSRPFSAATAS